MDGKLAMRQQLGVLQRSVERPRLASEGDPGYHVWVQSFLVRLLSAISERDVRELNAEPQHRKE